MIFHPLLDPDYDSEISSGWSKLTSLDPMRRGFYEDMRRKHESSRRGRDNRDLEAAFKETQ